MTGKVDRPQQPESYVTPGDGASRPGRVAPSLIPSDPDDQISRQRQMCRNLTIEGLEAACDEVLKPPVLASSSTERYHRPTQSGDRIASLDVAALDAQRDYLRSNVGWLEGRPYRFVSEDGADLPRPDDVRPGGLVYRSDSIDGSTNCKVLEGIFSSVCISYERTETGSRFLAGAVDTGRQVVSIDAHKAIFVGRTDRLPFAERRESRLAPPGQGALAMHASTPDRAAFFERLRSSLLLRRSYDVGGTPLATRLAWGECDLTVNPSPCADYDAFHVVPFLAMGGYVANGETGDYFTFNSFIELLESQNIDDPDSKIVPPYVAGKTQRLCEDALDVLERFNAETAGNVSLHRRAS